MKVADRNYTIDVFRLLGAFCIIIIHAAYGAIATDTMSNILVINIRLLSRWAVPFFFLISGFFLEKRYRVSPGQSLLKSLKNLTSIAIVVNLVYFSFLLVTDPSSLINLINLSTILEGSYLHLWFIGSLVFGTFIVWFLIECNLQDYFLVIAVTIAVLVLLLDVYAAMFHILIKPELSRFLQSIPFLIWGYLRSRDIHLRKIYSITGSLILIGFGIIIQLTEALLIYKVSGYSPYKVSLTLGTIIFSIGMFFLSLRLSIKKSFLSDLGEKYSLLIYLYHPIVYSLINYIIFNLHLTKSAIFIWLSPIINLSITVAIVHAINKLFPKGFRVLSGFF